MLCPEQQLSCLQKTKNADRKKELQLELRKVQQQIKEEQAQRQRQALDAERKVPRPSYASLHQFGASGASTLGMQAFICHPAKHMQLPVLMNRCKSDAVGALFMPASLGQRPGRPSVVILCEWVVHAS